MTLTPSTMLELGTIAPDFTLPAADGDSYALAGQNIDKGLLVVFMCNHCPYVKHIIGTLVEVARRYQHEGITVVAINSNDFSAYPDDSPENMTRLSRQLNFPFPYLIDEQQDVARAYRAACTPDLFLFDQDKKLVYRGQFDSSRPGKDEPVSGHDLGRAIEQLTAGEPITLAQKPSMGCNIKWKEQNRPDYFSA